MELPTRPQTDRFTKPGRYREFETQIRRRVQRDDTPILFIYAFDPSSTVPSAPTMILIPAALRV